MKKVKETLKEQFEQELWFYDRFPKEFIQGMVITFALIFSLCLAKFG